MGLSKPLIVNTTTESVDLSALETAIADVKTSADNAWTYAVMGYNSAETAKTNAADAKTQATNAATYAGNVNSRLTSARAGYLDKLNTGVPTAINGAIGLTGTTSKLSTTETTLGSWSGKGHAVITLMSQTDSSDYGLYPTITIDGVTSALYNGTNLLSGGLLAKAPYIDAYNYKMYRIEIDFDTSLVVKGKLSDSNYNGYINVTIELK